MDDKLLFFARDSNIADERVFRRLHLVRELLLEHKKEKSIEKLDNPVHLTISALFVYNDLRAILNDRTRKLYRRVF